MGLRSGLQEPGQCLADVRTGGFAVNARQNVFKHPVNFCGGGVRGSPGKGSIDCVAVVRGLLRADLEREVAPVVLARAAELEQVWLAAIPRGLGFYRCQPMAVVECLRDGE